MKQYSKRDLLDLVGHQPKERLPYHDVRDDGLYLRDPTEFEVRVGLVDIPVEHPTREPGKPALPFPFTLRQFLDFERTARVVAEMGDEEVEALARRNPQSYELARAARDDEAREFWKSWITRELWTLIEAACLLAGRPPTSERNFDKKESTGGIPARIYRSLKDSTLAGTIKFVEVDGVLQRRRVTPRDVVGWAMSHGLEVPAPLAHLKDGYEDPLLEEARLQVEARRAAGRYTLEEAAKAIAERTGERLEAVHSRLLDAARRSKLPTYAPGSGLPIRYDGDGASPVRDFYDEAYGSDLNKWLAEPPLRIAFRFAVGPSVSASDAGAAPLKEGAGAPIGAGPAAESSDVEARRTIHRLAPSRDVLDPAIREALRTAVDPSDRVAVWNAFVALARLKPPFAPLLEATQGEVKYQTADSPKFISRDAFFKRLARRNPPQSAATRRNPPSP